MTNDGRKILMLLGGIYYLKPAIEVAHELGYYVITADYLPNNTAHQWSDEFVHVSIIDKEAVLEVARNKKIDGILSYAVDPGVETAAYVAEKLGLPNVGPYKSVKILQNKSLFRKFLRENNFNTPLAESYFCYEDALNDIDKFVFPIIVKPVDSAGSKGVSRVEDVSCLKRAIEYAQRFSHSNGEFIIEEFIELYGFQSGSDSFSINGKMVYTTFDDQCFDKNSSNPYTPAMHIWPSSMSIKAQEYLKSEIQRLVTLLDMHTSIYNIEVRVGVDGKPYIMELSPRAGGNRLAELIRVATGVDMIKVCVLAAMGNDVELECNDFDAYYVDVILHSNSRGVFKSVNISNKIKNNLIDVSLYKKVGESICEFGAANDTVGSVFLKFNNRELLDFYLDNQQELINVIVE